MLERSSLRFPPRLRVLGPWPASAPIASSSFGSAADSSALESMSLNKEGCSGTTRSDLDPKKRQLASRTCSSKRAISTCCSSSRLLRSAMVRLDSESSRASASLSQASARLSRASEALSRAMTPMRARISAIWTLNASISPDPFACMSLRVSMRILSHFESILYV